MVTGRRRPTEPRRADVRLKLRSCGTTKAVPSSALQTPGAPASTRWVEGPSRRSWIPQDCGFELGSGRQAGSRATWRVGGQTPSLGESPTRTSTWAPRPARRGTSQTCGWSSTSTSAATSGSPPSPPAACPRPMSCPARSSSRGTQRSSGTPSGPSGPLTSTDGRRRRLRPGRARGRLPRRRRGRRRRAPAAAREEPQGTAGGSAASSS
mmetsp:Transcript_80550/g.204733  ORF Transcript_80550/g.204733 Transcript_80550/m.204733 type:complete len:209 (+) Transcript_80550:468-1094(+)